jgi:hypothetical protein
MSSTNSNNTTNQQNIIPKDCAYKCGVRIYWNTSENAYFEVFTKQRHKCPNRSNNTKSLTQTTPNTTKPYYYKKPWTTSQPKPKMSNSFELLQGPIIDIQKKYEILSDIVTEYNGRIHGSQSHVTANNLISLFVYYEIPIEGNKRDEVKRKFENIKNEINNNYR